MSVEVLDRFPHPEIDPGVGAVSSPAEVGASGVLALAQKTDPLAVLSQYQTDLNAAVGYEVLAPPTLAVLRERAFEHRVPQGFEDESDIYFMPKVVNLDVLRTLNYTEGALNPVERLTAALNASGRIAEVLSHAKTDDIAHMSEQERSAFLVAKKTVDTLTYLDFPPDHFSPEEILANRRHDNNTVKSLVEKVHNGAEHVNLVHEVVLLRSIMSEEELEERRLRVQTVVASMPESVRTNGIIGRELDENYDATGNNETKYHYTFYDVDGTAAGKLDDSDMVVLLAESIVLQAQPEDAVDAAGNDLIDVAFVAFDHGINLATKVNEAEQGGAGLCNGEDTMSPSIHGIISSEVVYDEQLQDWVIDAAVIDCPVCLEQAEEHLTPFLGQLPPLQLESAVVYASEEPQTVAYSGSMLFYATPYYYPPDTDLSPSTNTGDGVESKHPDVSEKVPDDTNNYLAFLAHVADRLREPGGVPTTAQSHEPLGGEHTTEHRNDGIEPQVETVQLDPDMVGTAKLAVGELLREAFRYRSVIANPVAPERSADPWHAEEVVIALPESWHAISEADNVLGDQNVERGSAAHLNMRSNDVKHAVHELQEKREREREYLSIVFGSMSHKEGIAGVSVAATDAHTDKGHRTKTAERRTTYEHEQFRTAHDLKTETVDELVSVIKRSPSSRSLGRQEAPRTDRPVQLTVVERNRVLNEAGMHDSNVQNTPTELVITDLAGAHVHAEVPVRNEEAVKKFQVVNNEVQAMHVSSENTFAADKQAPHKGEVVDASLSTRSGETPDTEEVNSSISSSVRQADMVVEGTNSSALHTEIETTANASETLSRADVIAQRAESPARTMVGLNDKAPEENVEFTTSFAGAKVKRNRNGNQPKISNTSNTRKRAQNPIDVLTGSKGAAHDAQSIQLVPAQAAPAHHTKHHPGRPQQIVKVQHSATLEIASPNGTVDTTNPPGVRSTVMQMLRRIEQESREPIAQAA